MNLRPIGLTLPTTESQTRPLTTLEPEQQIEAWRQVIGVKIKEGEHDCHPESAYRRPAKGVLLFYRALGSMTYSNLALRMQDAIAAKAKANQLSGLKQGNESPVLLNSTKREEPVIEPINTREEIAKVAEVSEDTIRKVKKILAEATEDVKQQAQTALTVYAEPIWISDVL